jgi:hypothetical protein
MQWTFMFPNSKFFLETEATFVFLTVAKKVDKKRNTKSSEALMQ